MTIPAWLPLMHLQSLYSLVVVVVVVLQDFVTRAKLGVQHMVQKVGFFGILACASVSRKFSGLFKIILLSFLTFKLSLLRTN